MVTPGIKIKLKYSFARVTRQKGLLQRAASYYKLFSAKSCLQIPTVRHHSISVGLLMKVHLL